MQLKERKPAEIGSPGLYFVYGSTCNQVISSAVICRTM